jgi:hypothetical protein
MVEISGSEVVEVGMGSDEMRISWSRLVLIPSSPSSSSSSASYDSLDRHLLIDVTMTPGRYSAPHD